MAKKQTDTQPSSTRETTALTVPSGFSLVHEGEKRWWLPALEDGSLNPIQCIPLAKQRRPDDDGYEYRCRATGPCYARNGDGEIQEVSTGSIVYVSEYSQLTGIEAFLLVPEEAEVLIVPKGKRKIKSGRSVWNIDIHARPTGKRRPIPASPRQLGPGAPAEDEPGFFE